MFLIILFLVAAPVCSLSAVGEGIPVSFILFQTFNFLIFLGFVVYLFLKKAPPYILQQYNDYISMKNRAENLYRQAEDNIKKTQHKLSQIKEKSGRFDEELNFELEKMSVQLDQDLKEQKDAVLRTAQNFIDQKLIKLKTGLNKKFIDQVFTLCRENLKDEKQDSRLFAQKLRG